MTYLTYGFCALTIAWLAYLLFRSRKLRIPGRLGACSNVGILEVCVLIAELLVLLGIAIWATTQDEQGIWALLLPLMLLSVGFVAALSVNVHGSMAFDAEGFVICRLFGEPKRYAWSDVLDCRTIKTVVPRSNKPCNMYCMKLTDRDIALPDYTAGAGAFIRELRRHKPLMNIPVPGRNKT